MKNEDLFYAMSFLDEDLIEEANRADTKAVVTPVKKTSKPKARVISLVAPWIAAAAALLVVGGLIIYGSSASSSGTKSQSGRMDNEAAGERSSALMETTGADRSDSDSYSYDNGPAGEDSYYADDADEVEELIPGTTAEPCDGHETTAAYSLDLYSDIVRITVGDDTYIVYAFVPSDEAEEVRGDFIGNVSGSDNEDLVDQEVYMYTGLEDRVLVYFADADEYYLALREDV